MLILQIIISFIEFVNKESDFFLISDRNYYVYVHSIVIYL